MTMPPHGPRQHGGHGHRPHWATPPHRPAHPGAAAPQHGGPAGPPPQQWGAPPPPQWGPPGGPPPQQWGTPPGQPPQWGPQQQWGAPPTPNPAPQPKGNGLLIGIAVAVVAVLVIGVGAFYLFTRDDKTDSASPSTRPTSAAPSSSAASPTSIPPLTPSTKGGSTPSAPKPGASLAAALLPASELTERMKLTMSESAGESGSAPLSDVTVSPTNCTAAYLPASSEAYAGSGYTEMTVAGYRGPGNSIGTSIIEAIAKFPDAAAAKNFVDSQLGKWKACKSTNVSATYGDGATLSGKLGWAFQSRSDTVTVDLLTNIHAGSNGCEHSITYSGDVVIDARFCSDGTNGHNAGGESTSLVHAIQRNLR